MSLPPDSPLPPAPPPPLPVRHAPRRVRALEIALGVALVLLLLGLVAYARFTTALDALRSGRTASPGWSFPSRVYSDGVPFVPGAPLPPSYLEAELTARGYARVPGRPVVPGTWSSGWMATRGFGVIGAPGGGTGYEIVLRGFDQAVDPAGFGGPERIRLAISGGRLTALQRLGGLPGRRAPDPAHPPRLEPVPIATLLDAGHVRRTWVPLSRIPRALQDAVVASEDRRFYRHIGLDLKGNFRALLTNARAGGVRQGGSTITQQLARALFLTRARTWNRKLTEMALAVGLEMALTKPQILEMYLNSAYFGQGAGGGIAGVEEAARWYFDMPVESLKVVEAATLVGMIPAPNVYSPFRSPRLARARRNAVLDDMVATGRLSAAAAARAKAWPLDARHGEPPTDRDPSYVAYVHDVLSRQLPPGAAERRGFAVFTRLDLAWQQQAEEELARGVGDQERWRGRSPQPLQGAFVVLDPASAAVRVLVGGRAPRAGDFNRAFQAHRQTGSAIKPVVYAAALDPARGGARWTPATTVPDLRRTFATQDSVWSPRNDEGDYHPQVTLAKALAKSLNVATSNVVEQIGAATVARYAQAFGLGTMKPVPSIGLGPNEVTLLALANAYAVFPAGGVRREPTPLRAVVDATGRSLRVPLHVARVLPAATAALMTGLLEDVVIYGVAYPLRAQYGFTRPSGGKTGTTNDYNDAWYVGFTPGVVAGVWVGYDVPESLRRPAAQSALPVWAGIMNRLLDGFPADPFPSDAGLELAWIDPWSGKLAGAGCPTMRVPFLPGTTPTEVCTNAPAWEFPKVDTTGAAPGATPAESSGVQARVTSPR
ncbi:MAG TPA: transglycosylase domain-containing protein [Candidatus Eisenbacteria bacterium]|nr:transglycosylase domain-containing protein [Candidatus Eisenbacteria bacterium]